MNDELVDWDKATVHVATHSLHYGTGVYEGVRAYETDEGAALFRLTDHIERLYRSAKILGMPMPYSVGHIVDACKETSPINRFDKLLRQADRLPRLRAHGTRYRAVRSGHVHYLLALGLPAGHR